jgi:hypothetical protein
MATISAGTSRLPLTYIGRQEQEALHRRGNKLSCLVSEFQWISENGRRIKNEMGLWLVRIQTVSTFSLLPRTEL